MRNIFVVISAFYLNVQSIGFAKSTKSPPFNKSRDVLNVVLISFASSFSNLLFQKSFLNRKIEILEEDSALDGCFDSKTINPEEKKGDFAHPNNKKQCFKKMNSEDKTEGFKNVANNEHTNNFNISIEDLNFSDYFKGSLKVFFFFFVWYFFRLLVKSMFFPGSVAFFSGKINYLDGKSNKKNQSIFENPRGGRIFYLKKNSINNNTVILHFPGIRNHPRLKLTEDINVDCDIAAVQYRYQVNNENESIFERIRNLFMVSEKSVFEDAERLYDYVTDELGYNKVLIKTHSFGGAVGAHLVKYAEEKARRNQEKSRVGGLFIGSSISGVYTSSKQFTFEIVRRIFENSIIWRWFSHFLKYPAALISKISLIDYSLDPVDSLKNLENKELKVVVYDGGQRDFLNNKATGLSEKLKKSGIKYVKSVTNEYIEHNDVIEFGSILDYFKN